MTAVDDVVKELYRFIEGDSAFIYTITSSDEPEVYNAGDGDETYSPLAIGRDEVEGKGEMSRQNLKISFSIDNPIARRWFVSSLDFPLTVTIFSKDHNVIEVEFKGRLASVSPNGKQIDFTFENVFTSMRRMGLRQRYQITCPHSLYGKGCNLNKEDFALTGAVTNVTNSVVTMPLAGTYDDHYFTSGIFEDQDGNLRFITSHVGTALTLIRPMNALIDHIGANGYAGLNCRIFPGCNRSAATCAAKFGNLLNHGGFPFMPNTNPFSGTSIV